VEAVLPASVRQAEGGPGYVPAGLSGLCCYRSPGASCWAHVVLRRLDQAALEADLRLLDDGGKVVLEIAGLGLEALHAPPVAADEPPATPTAAGPVAAPVGTAVLTRDTLLAVDTPLRHGLLQSYLRTQLAAILGMTEARLDAEVPLRRLGLDSLMTYRLALRLERTFHVSLDPKDLDERQSVMTLATLLLGRMNGEGSAATAS
jgi:acyl carrier protein